jgi:hypothetical protein
MEVFEATVTASKQRVLCAVFLLALVAGLLSLGAQIRSPALVPAEPYQIGPEPIGCPSCKYV